jgi:hypothetical protein
MVVNDCIQLIKRILWKGSLIVVPLFIAFFVSYSFLDEISIYLNWFGYVLLFWGSCYVGISLFLRKKNRLGSTYLLIVGLALFFFGLLSIIYYYNFMPLPAELDY